MTEITDQDRQNCAKWRRLHFLSGGEKLLRRALDEDKVAFAAILLEEGYGTNALNYAVWGKHGKRLKNLIAAGFDLEAGTEDGDCMPPLCATTRNGNLAAARMLVEAGCNINAQTAFFSTALILATVRNQPAIAYLMMENGADPTIKGHQNRTALERAKNERLPFQQALEDYEAQWKAQRQKPRPLLLPPPAGQPEPVASDDGWSYVGGAGCDMVIQKISDSASDTHIKNIFDFAAKRFITEIVSNGSAPQMIVEKLDTAGEALLAQARKKRAEKAPEEPGLT
jgi:hypothetical protein